MSSYERRSFKGNVSKLVTLAADITSGSTTFTVSDGSSFLDGSGGPFTITIGSETSAEEKVDVASRSGNTLTVNGGAAGRGFDGTTAAAHSAGVKVEHTVAARDLDEANNAVRQTIGAVAAKGDMLSGSAANALVKTSVGADGTVWTADAASPGGAHFAAATVSAVAWTSYTPTFRVGGSSSTTGIANRYGAYTILGKTIHFNVEITYNGAPAVGSVTIDLPFAASSTATKPTWVGTIYCRSQGLDNSGIAVIARSGTIVTPFIHYVGTSPQVGLVQITKTLPGTFANGDFITIQGCYEIP